ncbi:MAG TPA: hypothetical protein VIA06_03200 [Candidatus Dormibacteraeota bacterium]|jgi:hypothetical protein|nr:hypothetical protein [Candidatus Dormibacteraeota bacterium]
MIRSVLIAALAASLGLLLTGCGAGGSGQGSGASAQTTCAGASAPHHAYLIVTHADGKSVQRCVSFKAAEIGGTALMKGSHLEYQTQSFSFGPAMCQIDHQPTSFTQCLSSSGPYWSLYVYQGGHWKEASKGFADTDVTSGGALGWIYETSSSKQMPAKPKT